MPNHPKTATAESHGTEIESRTEQSNTDDDRGGAMSHPLVDRGLDAIRDCYDELGRPPSRQEVEQAVGSTLGPLNDEYPKWNDALEAAGVPTFKDIIEFWICDKLLHHNPVGTPGKDFRAKYIVRDIDPEMGTARIGIEIPDINDHSDACEVEKRDIGSGQSTRWRAYLVDEDEARAVLENMDPEWYDEPTEDDATSEVDR